MDCPGSADLEDPLAEGFDERIQEASQAGLRSSELLVEGKSLCCLFVAVAGFVTTAAVVKEKHVPKRMMMVKVMKAAGQFAQKEVVARQSIFYTTP